MLVDHGGSHPEPRQDQVEATSFARNDAVEDLYREGVATILEHIELSSVARIRALMAWTGFWLLTLQHSRAHSYLDRQRTPIICDCGARHPQLRRAAQKSLRDAQSVILEAVDAGFVESAGRSGRLSAAQRNKIRGFLAISEFPKWRKYLISLSFRDK